MTTKLIFQSGTSNKFWNITQEGNKHTVTFGRVGTDGTSKTKEFADEAAAIKDATKLINAKKKKGYQEAAEKASIIRDEYTFAGKPIKVFSSSFKADTAVKVLSGYDEELKITDKLEKLAKQPNIAELDTLVLGVWQEAAEGAPNPALNKLIELKDSFSGLKHLFVGDIEMEECEMSWIIQADYTDFYQHFPALETFGVRGGGSLKLGKLGFPNLKNLIIETGGLDSTVIIDLLNSDLKKLEHLEIWLGTDEYGRTFDIEDLSPIINDSYPNLKFLGLKNYDQQTELAKALNGAAILNSLEILDLSMGTLTDEGAEALFNNPALLKLKHLNLRHHYLSDEWVKKLKIHFAAQKVNLHDQEEADEWDDEVYYYVEIGE